MILSLLGFLSLLLPFLVLFSSKNKPRDFAFILAGSTLTYLAVAVVTESLHLFTYTIVISIHLLLVASFLLYAHKKKWLSNTGTFRFDKYLVLLCLFAFVFLSSLHFFYTGPVDSERGLQYVKTDSYPFPFYSDEWVAVGLVNYTIESHSLPFANPLFENRVFPNYLFLFDSLLAYLFLILNISVLAHYVWFAILNTVIIISLVYLLFRCLGVSGFASFMASLTLLFITNSGNLPGLWNLLPYNMSLDFLIIGMIGLVTSDTRLSYLGFTLSTIIYPPILVFVLPIILGFLFKKDIFWYKKVSSKKIYLLLLFVTFLVFVFKAFDIFDLVIRSRLDMGMVYYEPWNVLPSIIIPFVILGLWRSFKERNFMLIFPIIIGSFFWILHIFVPFVFIIEQNRAVIITSIFLVLVSVYGIDLAIGFCSKRFEDVFDAQGLLFLKTILFLFYICMGIFSSHFGLWHKLILRVDAPDGRRFIPAPPVTRYLQPDDLELFKDIKGKRFISPSWKGLVIGVATENFPLDSKTSTISNLFVRYEEFVTSDCKAKKSLIDKYNISYAYIATTSCAGFKELGRSSEGLVLYELK